MTRPPLRERLQQGVLVLDGGMGTQIYERGIPFQECFERLNVDQPHLVREIHRGFLDAGAHALLTNTFGGNRHRLDKHGFAARQREFLEAGARLAREAAGEEHWVLGSLGPLGVEMEPLGRLSRDETRAAFREAAEILAPWVDGIVLETFSNAQELEQAVRAVREVDALPVLAFLTVTDGGRTLHGTSPVDGVRLLEAAGADAVGFNCSSGPGAVLNAALAALPVAHVPVGAQPNAGMPREVEGRIFYENDPDYFARFARRFLQAGGRIVGGCCGTTPEHVRALARAARRGTAQAPDARPERRAPRLHVRERAPKQAVPLAERSRFGRRLAERASPVSVELLPPRTPDMRKVLDAARRLHAAGADAINLPDGPRASARISNTAAAAIIEREVGIETLLHFCCRDRNLLGMQSDLLGCAALGLRNVLVITGDPPYQGNYPDVTAVFDVDAIGLCNIVDQLNHGLDLGGNPIETQTEFCFGAAFNHSSLDLPHELERFHWKAEAGVDFFITQPVFDDAQFLEVLARLPAERPPILAGLWPLRSLRNAEFLHSEVPGVSVPDAVLDRMRAAEERGRAGEEGVRIACESVDRLAPHVQGFQIAAPFNRVEPALEVLARTRAGG